MTVNDQSETVAAISIDVTLKVICGKWKPFILMHLLERDLRYGELRRAIPGVSEKVLIEQLNDLSRQGVVRRVDYNAMPRRVEYGLTAYGYAMRPLLECLSNWGTSHAFRESATMPV